MLDRRGLINMISISETAGPDSAKKLTLDAVHCHIYAFIFISPKPVFC